MENELKIFTVLKVYCFAFIFLNTNIAFAQKDTIDLHFDGLTMIKNGPFTNALGDCIWCNPEIMFDRIILDSTKTMIARKVSSPAGYVYNEWRGENYSKTNEEIQINYPFFKRMVYFTDSNKEVEEYTLCKTSFNIKYYKNSVVTINRLRLQLEKNIKDSLIRVYKIPSTEINNDSKCWQEFYFYENGNLQSEGTVFWAINSSYRIGKWKYYNSDGKLEKEEILKSILKIK